MRATAVLSAAEELRGLQGRIEGWRRSPSRPRGMPEPLWQEACDAARRLGTYRVARALGLNYDNLKRRMAVSSGSVAPVTHHERSAAVGFVDLGKVAALGVPSGADQMVVELVAADGTRLTIRTRHAGAAVLEMISAFRGRS